jgi:RNA methyltransferase, TrmH family
MATQLGSRAERLIAVRALRAVKGRREQGRFAFEGATLLAEAVESGAGVAELYVTQSAYDSQPLVRRLEAAATPVFLLDEAAAARISDLATPSGIVAVAPVRLTATRDVFHRPSPILVLADLNDPANVGTLLRSADAFGCTGVVFGRLGVDPYNPKVVRGSMGALFRLTIGVDDPGSVGQAAKAAGVRLLGLASRGAPLTQESWTPPLGLVIGNERHGLGGWASLCDAILAIPMSGRAESLSAAVAGSIALYEASRFLPCQESASRLKSQDYRC